MQNASTISSWDFNANAFNNGEVAELSSLISWTFISHSSPFPDPLNGDGILDLGLRRLAVRRLHRLLDRRRRRHRVRAQGVTRFCTNSTRKDLVEFEWKLVTLIDLVRDQRRHLLLLEPRRPLEQVLLLRPDKRNGEHKFVTYSSEICVESGDENLGFCYQFQWNL